MEDNNCRFYRNQYPEVEDLVLVTVKKIEEMGAYVELLEYNNIDGMILLSELSRRRIRSINKLIRVGRSEVVVVLRVDRDKGYIDLSKRRVSPEDIKACEEKYNKSKAVHSILRNVSEKVKIPLIDLYERFGWDLYDKYGHAYDAFKIIVTEPEKVLDQYELDPKVRSVLVKTVCRRLTPQALKLRADVELSCFTYMGIEAVREALKTGEACGTPDTQITIKLVAPPLYVLMCTSLDKEKGIKLLQDACDKMEEVIKKHGGEMAIKNQARAISERDDQALTQLMEKLEKQNTEIAGDDPDDD